MCSLSNQTTCFSMCTSDLCLNEHWSPHLKYNIDAIEHVQRRFTKRLPGLNNCTYGERLHRLGILTLELRRLRSDLRPYMVLQNYLRLCKCHYNFVPNEEIHKHYSWSSYKLYKQRSSCTAQSSFFTERVVNVWNSLPADRDFSSLSSFITQINVMNFE